MATCFPSRGRPFHRPDLIACARSSTWRSSCASRSAMSRKSRPVRVSCTEAIMIARRTLQAGFDQVAGDDRRDGKVPRGIELRQADAKPGIVSQPEDEVAAGGWAEAELSRLERDRRLVLEVDREPVGEGPGGAGVGVGQG